MSKVTLKVEIDEETYKQIKGDSVYDNNNKIIISKSSSAYYALNAIINATPITKSDDAVSRQALINVINETYGECNAISYTDEIRTLINALPPVLPKHEGNTVSEERYTEEYIQRKKLEYELYVLKKKISDLI